MKGRFRARGRRSWPAAALAAALALVLVAAAPARPGQVPASEFAPLPPHTSLGELPPPPPPEPVRAPRASRKPEGLTPFAGTGRLKRVPGTSRPAGNGRMMRYVVEIERGLNAEPDEIARRVDRTLADRRGWIDSGRVGFVRVNRAPVELRITLAGPELTDSLCAPLRTNGRFSCHSGDRVVLNAWRWREGASAFAGDVSGYRRYLVNHEVGHALGFGHSSCPGEGERSPVMAQQTKGVGACRAWGWPSPAEKAAVAPAG